MGRTPPDSGRDLLFAKAAILACIGLAFAQTPVRHTKVLTPEQGRYQAEVSQWVARHAELRAQAQKALSSEAARENASDCPDADTTRAQEECLASEIRKTQSNYAMFAEAIRTMLGLAYPTMPGEQPVSGPTGEPLTSDERVKEFDRLEAESKAYRDDASKAAYNQYRGGTLAPVFEAEAEQKLLRLHLEEMAFIYGEELSNH
ncbi:MAG: hypothetical protein JO211_05540 [Acidobacteriaceae bacterium]|nr:hypothetical protein [Acidobacteriaceae bacterium]